MQDKQTINVLILELATMVVAIALALAANLLTTFTLNELLLFIFTTALVIWFWWDYIVDRLSFPPRTMTFPLTDVLILILISLIPFALKQRSATPISSLISALLIIWAVMISHIRRENAWNIDDATSKELQNEVKLRVAVGVLFGLNALVDYAFVWPGRFTFPPLVVAVIIYNIYIRRSRRNALSVRADDGK